MARPSYDDGDSGGGSGSGMLMRPAYPSLTPVVKRLLIANVAIFLIQFFGGPPLQLTQPEQLTPQAPAGCPFIQWQEQSRR